MSRRPEMVEMSHQPERALTRSWCCGSTSSDTKCRNESSAREGIDTYLSLLSLCHIASCRNESSAREGIDTMRLVWICYPVFIRGRNESSAREGIDTINQCKLQHYKYPVEMSHQPERALNI